MELSIETVVGTYGWQVRMSVCLDRGETSELFLAGDALISWPTEGLVATAGDSPFERSSMFLSEVVARTAGLALVYETEEAADLAAKILVYQVRAALPGEQAFPVEKGGAIPVTEIPATDAPAVEGATAGNYDPTYAMMTAYLDVPGIMAAILVSDQGLVINSARKEDVDTDTVSALVVDIVAAAQRFGRESKSGALDTLTIEFEGLNLVLAPFGADCMLALVGHPGAFSHEGAL